MEEGMATNIVKERLIEAAKVIEYCPNFKMAVLTDGVLLSLIWKTRSGDLNSTGNMTTWRVIEDAKINPLIQAMTSLSKQRASKQ
jgi:hypothetical protein